MFVIVKLQDLVQISPAEIEKPHIQVIEDNINAKYANKVIKRTGLCICLLDVIRTTEGMVGHKTGLINVNVEFRLIVFRPFKGEILEGVITHSDPRGIWVSTDFFNDIWIPLINLFDGTAWRQSENLMVWTTEDGNELFFDLHEVVRFRVEGESWHDPEPKPPRAEDDEEEEPENKISPYMLTGSMQQGGLGPILWWGEVEAEEEAEEMAEE